MSAAVWLRFEMVTSDHLCYSWSHPYLTGLTNEEVWAELYYSLRISQAVMGITPTCFRPPYGDIDDRCMERVTAIRRTRADLAPLQRALHCQLAGRARDDLECGHARL